MQVQTISMPVYSPFQDKLNALIDALINKSNQIDETGKQAINNVLHFTVTQRFAMRDYSGDNRPYLQGLLKDVSAAYHEYEQACFSHDMAVDTFDKLKRFVLTLLKTEVNN